MKNYKYDAYGEPQGTRLNPAGDQTIIYQWKAETERVYNPFGFCGEYSDAESGLIYLRARMYDPSTGRFINEDPIRDGLNWYVYCGGNPVMFVDPWGLIREPGYVDGVWCEDPDAYEFGKDSVKYQILVALGDAWMNTDSEEKRAKYHKAADVIRGYDANVNTDTLNTVYLLNNKTGASNNGHNAIMLTNSDGEGVFFSFYPEGGSYPLASGQMRFKLLTSNQVDGFKKSGSISGAIALGKYSATRQNETYTGYISVSITATQAKDMLKKGISYVVNPGTYMLVGNQCDNVASKIMAAGNKKYYVSNKPNWSFEGVSKDWGLQIINMGE